MSRYTKVVHFTPLQEQLILGSLLGDASLSKPPNGKNYHWSVYHAGKQAEYLQWKYALLCPWSSRIQVTNYVDKRDGKARPGGRFHLPSQEWFTELRHELYPSSTKQLTPQFLKRIKHPIALATLIGDDGSWDKSGIQISSKQFTEAENGLLAFYLTTTFGIRITPFFSRPYHLLRIPSDQIAKVHSLCLSLLPESMWYKFGGADYRTTLVGKVWHTCERCSRAFLEYESAERRFCSRLCAAQGRLASVWTTRRALYGSSGIKRRIPPLPPCVICGTTVKRLDRQTCSQRCGNILGHRNRSMAAT